MDRSRIDDLHQAMLERVAGVVTARIVIGPAEQVLAVGADLGGQPGQRQGTDRIQLGVVGAAGFVELAAIDGRHISTQVAGGFTGRVIGVEALGSDALLTRLSYSAL